MLLEPVHERVRERNLAPLFTLGEVGGSVQEPDGVDGVAGGPCSPDVECVDGVLSRFEAVPVLVEGTQRSIDALVSAEVLELGSQ